MSIAIYSKYRRMGLRKAWSLSGMDNVAVYVTAGILVLLTAYTLVAWYNDSIEQAEKHGRAAQKEEAEQARADADKASKKLAAAMNGGALLDRDNGDAYFFQVSRERGL